jgi:hypothetical protein
MYVYLASLVIGGSLVQENKKRTPGRCIFWNKPPRIANTPHRVASPFGHKSIPLPGEMPPPQPLIINRSLCCLNHVLRDILNW